MSHTHSFNQLKGVLFVQNRIGILLATLNIKIVRQRFLAVVTYDGGNRIYWCLMEN